MLGDDITMMLDFGYRWHDWHDALWVLRRIEDCNIYFAEATLQHDDLHGHARLSQMSPIRICGAELAATRWEVREWIETGKVAVVQPDISPLRRPDRDPAHRRHVRAIRRTGHTSRLENRHTSGGRPALSGACPNAPYFEFISPHVYQSPLREKLVQSGTRNVEEGIWLYPLARSRHRARRSRRRDLSRQDHDRYASKLHGKRALVYGGGTGLGFACAEACSLPVLQFSSPGAGQRSFKRRDARSRPDRVGLAAGDFTCETDVARVTEAALNFWAASTCSS